MRPGRQASSPIYARATTGAAARSTRCGRAESARSSSTREPAATANTPSGPAASAAAAIRTLQRNAPAATSHRYSRVAVMAASAVVPRTKATASIGSAGGGAASTRSSVTRSASHSVSVCRAARASSDPSALNAAACSGVPRYRPEATQRHDDAPPLRHSRKRPSLDALTHVAASGGTTAP